ncbi:hypothetical protein ACVMIH_002496 [Bradyrhizobium sp. USDA 4503]
MRKPSDWGFDHVILGCREGRKIDDQGQAPGVIILHSAATSGMRVDDARAALSNGKSRFHTALKIRERNFPLVGSFEYLFP